MNERTLPSPEAGEVLLQPSRGGIPWYDYQGKHCSNGPSKGQGNQRLAHPHESQGCVILPRICKLLPQVHP